MLGFGKGSRLAGYLAGPDLTVEGGQGNSSSSRKQSMKNLVLRRTSSDLGCRELHFTTLENRVIRRLAVITMATIQGWPTTCWCSSSRSRKNGEK